MTHPQTVRSLPQRPVTFRDRAIAALETHAGADWAAYVAMLHEEDMAETLAQAQAARTSLNEVAAAAAVDQQLLASLMGVVAPIVRGASQAAARTAHLSALVRDVATLAREAKDAGQDVSADQIMDVLAVKQGPPAFRPIALGFVPATHFRVGHFRHVQAQSEVHLPFVGYASCEDAPDRPMTTHLAFLRDGAVRAVPQLYVEHGLMLEHVE